MPRRNSGWLSNRAMRMRSAKGGLQLMDFKLGRIGNGIGTDFDQELAADRLDAVVESAQPLRVVRDRALDTAFHFNLEQIAAALGAHGLQSGSLIQGLAHEAVEAALDGKRDLLWQALQLAAYRLPGTAFMATHGGRDRVGERELVELGGSEALGQIANVIERFFQRAANGLDIFAVGLAPSSDLSEQGPQGVELEQSHGHALHGSAEKFGTNAPHMQFVHVRETAAGLADAKSELVFLLVGA